MNTPSEKYETLISVVFVAYSAVMLMLYTVLLVQGINAWWLIASVGLFGLIIIGFLVMPKVNGRHRGGLDAEVRLHTRKLQGCKTSTRD